MHREGKGARRYRRDRKANLTPETQRHGEQPKAEGRNTAEGGGATRGRGDTREWPEQQLRKIERLAHS
jgi:hypothetical protein